MLEPAIKYKEQLKQAFYNTWFKEKYKFYHNEAYYNELTIYEDTWNYNQFVSVVDGKVIGYISYQILRNEYYAQNLAIINFTDNSIAFGRDLKIALQDIFETYKLRKLKFSVVIGNPIEKSYDKMIKNYGGRIVGVYKENCKLIDGLYYDTKIYEILASDYFTAKEEYYSSEVK